MSIRSNRKEEHLTLAQMFFDSQKQNSFDQMHLLRPALPESTVDLKSIQTQMFGKKVSVPFFINAMTGGSKKSFKVNQSLGKIANKTQIALALGSASILVKEHSQLDSFLIAREENPDGIIIANINAKTSADDAQAIIDELNADALQVHLNSVQEIAMPEGQRDFHSLDQLRKIRQKVTIPIIIKEVGFGLDQATIHLLKKEGFDYFDVAGSGGTNFAQIENARNASDVSYLETLGLSTVVSAMMAKKEKVNFIVSGGVRNPLDILKGLVLGGKYVGISNFFLQALMQNDEEYLLNMIQNWQKELANLIAIFGKNNLKDLTSIKQYYDLPLKSIIEQLL
ncbi:type 2 isopentenyl-diphosphate Delta-isomerase [Lactobacillus acetotolerans]|jgi:isopentenyl-diphosphate delta-isomerase|uniref:Isopentenyl-diphosphate delta-isomerase n=1 Tax=Lactobacillus acetotolerans TaxID=1600 RepID=A0A356VRT6_9LACO|nr:type 2 isopentenyl-diphosphate Delta-isomerase [Lactobacillus acetotolerans]MBN7276529.1 type 2 isopentenyl-diphosphate Delta-isomerase [Lactobacillus acetotolerans]QFG51292.1 type 2 isopentenyl-diphosphate Delta-isomerase [Lactobacillus acetotolerans]QGV04596.1 type 2 isopentenyl-diphosphate Delta-isomerase [Lactobacillus acetotolerans]QJD73589.1 type 2 isopentenyl-diphosphate Delta-isomerase [Lactobacillus acetotolerans]GGV08575.1 isopentenyl-diphosphate delta-isomerase [Lactobacillus ace